MMWSSFGGNVFEPLDVFFDSLGDVSLWRIAEEGVCFLNIGEGAGDVAVLLRGEAGDDVFGEYGNGKVGALARAVDGKEAGAYAADSEDVGVRSLQCGPQELHGFSKSGFGGFVDSGFGEIVENDFFALSMFVFVATEGIEVDAEVRDFEELEEVLLKGGEGSFEEFRATPGNEDDIDGVIHFSGKG